MVVETMEKEHLQHERGSAHGGNVELHDPGDRLHAGSGNPFYQP